MRISDWSSDVCSSDLPVQCQALERAGEQTGDEQVAQPAVVGRYHVPGCFAAVAFAQHGSPLRLLLGEIAVVLQIAEGQLPELFRLLQAPMQELLLLAGRKLPATLERLDTDRKSVVSGKSVSVRVNHGGRGVFLKK